MITTTTRIIVIKLEYLIFFKTRYQHHAIISASLNFNCVTSIVDLSLQIDKTTKNYISLVNLLLIIPPNTCEIHVRIHFIFNNIQTKFLH